MSEPTTLQECLAAKPRMDLGVAMLDCIREYLRERYDGHQRTIERVGEPSDPYRLHLAMQTELKAIDRYLGTEALTDGK